jgi:excisionase family DNA binding protein
MALQNKVGQMVCQLALTALEDRALGESANIKGDVPCEELRKVSDTAEILGVSPRYVYELIRQGELPAVRFGRYVRVPAAALQAWIADHQD